MGTAAAALCVVAPGVAALLIRFTGPEVWWLLRVAHVAAGMPVASLPVPSGMAGLLTLGGAGVLAVLLVMRPWHDSRVTRGEGAGSPK